MHIYGIHMKFGMFVVSAVMPRRNLPVSNAIAYYRALVYRWEIPLWVSKRCETHLISMPCKKTACLASLHFIIRKKYLVHLGAQDSVDHFPLIRSIPVGPADTVRPLPRLPRLAGWRSCSWRGSAESPVPRNPTTSGEIQVLSGAKSWKAIWGWVKSLVPLLWTSK